MLRSGDQAESVAEPSTDLVLDQNYELVGPERLKLHPRNVNIGDLGAIGVSIEQNGFYGAIVAQRSTGFILAGNHRFQAASAAGIKQLPVVWVDVDDDRALRILLADNRTTRLGQDDPQQLAALLQEILEESGSLDGTGFDTAALDDILASLEAPGDEATEGHTDQDACPDTPEKPVSVLGDVWQLGRHLLLCGDATSETDLRRLMGVDLADLVFTDPPYNVAYEGYTQDKLKIKNDAMTVDQFRQFLKDTFVSYRMAAKTGASLYVCHPSLYQREFQEAIEHAGFNIRCQIIWAKNTFAWGFGRYKFQHEPIFYCHVKGESDPWYGDKSQSTLWQEKKPAANRLHPTMKPVELIERALVNSSKKGDLVLDLFGGSGSTMIACEKNARSARLMELDPKYCDVIVKRWQDFTSKQAVLASTGSTFNEIQSSRTAKQ